MSIEMDKPKTAFEKIDAASNLVEQMMLAHTIKDESHFRSCHRKAGQLLFDALRQLEQSGDEEEWNVASLPSLSYPPAL